MINLIFFKSISFGFLNEMNFKNNIQKTQNILNLTLIKT